MLWSESQTWDHGCDEVPSVHVISDGPHLSASLLCRRPHARKVAGRQGEDVALRGGLCHSSRKELH